MTRTISVLATLGFIFLLGCSSDPDALRATDGPSIGSGGDAGADVDADANVDADADVDAGGDTFSVPALLADDDEITMNSPADVPARRQALIDFLWGPPGPPWQKLPAAVNKNVPNPIQTIPISNLARVDRLVIEMDQGLENEAFHFVPQTSNGRLVIVHQGHADTLDGDGLAETIAALVARGYGVLGGMMPCYNSFPCPGISVDESSPHNVLIKQVTPAEGNVLKYFVEHLVISLNYLKTQSVAGDFAPYHDFSMTGLSGGGWTTVLYSAIDPTITHSFPCSGSQPMYLRHCDGYGAGCIEGYDGDEEQMYFPLYKHVAGFLDLYAMGAAGAGRRQVQVQIRHDSCCFSQDQYAEPAGSTVTWNQASRAYEQKIQQFLGSGSDNQGSYRFEIDETSTHTHVISATTLAQQILGDLDGDRRPVAAGSATDVYTKGPYEHLWAGVPSWTDTTFPAVGTPAVVESAGGIDIFVRDPSSALIHLQNSGSLWTTETWPGIIASDPAGTLSASGLVAVAVASNSRLIYWSKSTNNVMLEQTADPITPVVGAPVLLSSGAGNLDVFVRRIDGGVQHVYLHGAAWATEEVTGTVFRGFPSGAVTLDGNLHMYARGEDNTLVEALKPLVGGAWALSSLVQQAGVPGTTMAGSPSAMVDPSSNDVIVMYRLPSGDLGQLTLPGDGMSGWAYALISRPNGLPPSMGTASLTFSPVAVPGGVFARAQEGGVWFYSQATGWSWTGQLM